MKILIYRKCSLWYHRKIGERLNVDIKFSRGLCERKQEISALIFDKKRNAVIYSQSQYVSKIPKMLDPIIPNLPYCFSDYKILAYNFEKQSTKVLVDLPSQNIIGVVIRIGFLDNGKKIAFQTH